MARYPIGRRVTVHYDPASPKVAVLEPGLGPNAGHYLQGLRRGRVLRRDRAADRVRDSLGNRPPRLTPVHGRTRPLSPGRVSRRHQMTEDGTDPGEDVAATGEVAPRPTWHRLALPAAGWLLVAGLFECAVETALRGSPLRWYVAAVVILWIVAMVLARRVLRDAVRISTGVLLFSGLVAIATWRLGAAADPGLHLCGLALPRIGVGLVLFAVVSALLLLLRLRLPRRADYVVGALFVLGVYSLPPLAIALYRGIPLAGAIRGDALWPDLPAWLQGGVIGLAGAAAVGAPRRGQCIGPRGARPGEPRQGGGARTPRRDDPDSVLRRVDRDVSCRPAEPQGRLLRSLPGLRPSRRPGRTSRPPQVPSRRSPPCLRRGRPRRPPGRSS